MADVACIGDPSNHGGSIISTGGSVDMRVTGIPVAVEGALHSCPLKGHGVTPITAITTDSRCGGKKLITTGAIAGCGAVINAPSRGANVE